METEANYLWLITRTLGEMRLFYMNQINLKDCIIQTYSENKGGSGNQVIIDFSPDLRIVNAKFYFNDSYIELTDTTFEEIYKVINKTE